LPPSSSSNRFIVLPPASKIFSPTPVEPVKLTMSMSRVSVRATEGSGRDDVMMLMTPGGNPTSCMISASSRMAKGS
jgi:hypothetical protein